MSQYRLNQALGPRGLERLPAKDVVGTSREEWAKNALLGWDNPLGTYFLSVEGRNGDPVSGLVWWFGANDGEMASPLDIEAAISRCFGQPVAFDEGFSAKLLGDANLPIHAMFGRSSPSDAYMASSLSTDELAVKFAAVLGPSAKSAERPDLAAPISTNPERAP